MEDKTTITIERTTRKRLDKIKVDLGMTSDMIINYILDRLEEKLRGEGWQ